MGQILHGSATTTETVRRAIQNSQASLRELADRYGINPKTVAKWKRRASPSDAPMGPKEPCSTVLSKEEEALVVAFRKHTLLPLDDCLYALQATLPRLTRSSLHRCFQRHGISRLPETEGDKPTKQRFKAYPIGYFHIDIAEVRTEEGKLYLFVAIDRTSKFVYAELHQRAKRQTASDFLKALVKVVPYKIHTVLTDNGIQFADLPKNRMGPTALWRGHMFDRVCGENDIEHRLTKPNHPWTNGQVERMNRTLKDATVKRYHYGTHAQLKEHVQAFLMAYNFAKRLKMLRGLTPYEYICKIWTTEPKRFRLNPLHHTVGLNSEAGLLDRRLGKPSPKRVPGREAERVERLYRERYSGFTAKHFHEHLVREHSFNWGYGWTKTFLQKRGLLAPAPRRGAHRRKRPRRAMVGMMLHQDGSRHHWVPGLERELDLIVTLDDATSEIYSAFLVAEEGTFSSFRGLAEVFSSHGLFCSLYSDRGSHYFFTPKAGDKVDKTALTQVGRALAQLGIEHIPAYSPEARGRSERAFRTLQDRLPKELGLAGITDLEAANDFIAKTYLPQHNRRFAITPADAGSAFVPARPDQWIDVLCVQHERIVANDNTVAINGLRLQIPSAPDRAHFVRATVRVHHYGDGT